MPFVNVKEIKKKDRALVGIVGPQGSGKTVGALEIATAIGGKIGLIDAEGGSSYKFRNYYDFDMQELESFKPAAYITAMQEAKASGYTTVIADGISPAWNGKDGILDTKDKMEAEWEKKNPGKKFDSFNAWRFLSPEHAAFVDYMIHYPLNLICTLRCKVAYEKDDVTKKIIKKGEAPIQRDGMMYEFDVVIDVEDNPPLAPYAMVAKAKSFELHGMQLALSNRDIAARRAAWNDLGHRIRIWLETGQGMTRSEYMRKQIVEYANLVGKLDEITPMLDMAGDDIAFLQTIFDELKG